MSRSSKASQSDPVVADAAYPYHAHTPAEVLAFIGVTENGLSTEEVERRQMRYGKNLFTSAAEPSLWHILFKQLKSPLAFVLLAAFAVTFALGEYVDATVIILALAVAVVVGIIQEGKSNQAFKKLADSQVRTATVLREGRKQEINASEVTVGDIVFLQSGARVPADVRLLATKQLSINESALSGEWLAVEKNVGAVPVGTAPFEQTPMAFMGTYVAEGYGTGVVVAVGDATEVGSIAAAVRDVEEVTTPIQEEMQRISHIMLYGIVALVALIFVLGLWQGQALEDMLLMSIAVAVASIPEGLPAAVTIILAVGMEALLRRGGLVRTMLAAETLGSTTFILTDKTGTLTEAKMKVTDVLTAEGTRVTLAHTEDQVLKHTLDIALCASDAYTDDHGEAPVIHGDSVEIAILAAAQRFAVLETTNSLRAARVDYLGFTSEQRFAAGLAPHASAYRLCVNGVPELLLEKATHLMTKEGEIKATKEAKAAIMARIVEETKAGRRLVAVAYKDITTNTIPETPGRILKDVVFAGVLVFADPVRSGVKEAIKGVRAAGAEVLLVTGDNPETALSIARQTGIVDRSGRALLGSELDALSDEALFAAISNVRVFARVLPKQKLRLAQVLQKHGEIVAMTGDGINDAPALRRANIGVAIGSGTEVAKEASDLVLVDDSFATIYAAIEEGRRITANLQKIVGYLLSTSLSEVVLIATALLVGAPVPILPVQILWANIIEEGFMSVAFAFERGDKNAMKRKPKDIHEEGILSSRMLTFVAIVVVVHGALLSGLYFYLRYLELPLEELRSVMFLVIAFDSLFISLSFRSLSQPFWRVPLWHNWIFVGSFLVSLVLFVAVLSVPILQELLSYKPIPAKDWVFVLGFSMMTVCAVECAKWLFFERIK